MEPLILKNRIARSLKLGNRKSKGNEQIQFSYYSHWLWGWVDVCDIRNVFLFWHFCFEKGAPQLAALLKKEWTVV
ncbi:hypothetical protein Lal_00018707 [Lupinus albus]|nr:hypothetical protein Lal_00018707 [Lupinus albus]